jgi:hypothetical protein
MLPATSWETRDIAQETVGYRTAVAYPSTFKQRTHGDVEARAPPMQRAPKRRSLSAHAVSGAGQPAAVSIMPYETFSRRAAYDVS